MPEELQPIQQAEQEAEQLLPKLTNFRSEPTARLRTLLDRLDTVFVQESLLNMVRLQPIESTDAWSAGEGHKNHIRNNHLWRRIRSHGYELIKEFKNAAEVAFPSSGEMIQPNNGLRTDFDEVRQLCLIYPEGLSEPSYNGKTLEYGSLASFYKELISLIPADIELVLQVKTRRIADHLRSANLHPRLRLVVNSELQGIWLRDYAGFNMGTHLVKPKYEPGVYWGNKAIARQISDNMKLLHSLLDLDQELIELVWDGGNMVTNGEYAFISEQLVLDNTKKYSQLEIEALIYQRLRVKAIWVKLPKADKLAHTDGYLTFISQTKALVSLFPPDWDGSEDEQCVTALTRQVQALGLNVERIMEHPAEMQSKTEIDSAVGLYVNLLQLNETWLVPTYNLPSDDETLAQLRRLNPGGSIVPINCTELAKLGGVLHCISFCN
jgi:agmatine/peptidylarginine deiminase